MKTLNLVDESKSDIRYKISKFPDGQQNVTITDSGKLNGFLKDTPVTIKSRLNNWLDLELIVCAVSSLRDCEFEEIHLYVPYIVGARSDRKFEEGGNNYLKDVLAPVINSLNFKTVTCIDPHSDVLEACIKGFRKESNLELVKFSIRNIISSLPQNYRTKLTGNLSDDIILISPDAGASKKIYKLAEQIGYKGDIITCSKDRDENGKLTRTVVPINGEHVQKDIIIIDDICDGGTTFVNISKKIKKKISKMQQYEENSELTYGKLYLIVTHGIFSKGFGELSKYFDGIYCTNSYGDALETFAPYSDLNGYSKDKIKQLNVF